VSVTPSSDVRTEGQSVVDAGQSSSNESPPSVRTPRGATGRIAAAGDDRAAVAAVMQLIDRLGFDPVDAGPLEAGPTLEPDGPVFGIAYSADEFSNRIEPSKAVNALG
jgi:predicted dinucleotide-binding enzyme